MIFISVRKKRRENYKNYRGCGIVVLLIFFGFYED